MKGGLRARMIADSYRVMIAAALNDLHWFDTGRRNAPLTFAKRPDDWQQSIAPNTITVNPEEWVTGEAGLGNEPFDRIRMYIDFYAENESLGMHVAHDLRDVILGLRPDLGRTGPELTIFDTRTSPPTMFTRADLVDVRVDRATGFPQPWQRHWFVISCFVEDDYLDDLDHAVEADGWSGSFAAAWADILETT